MTDIAKRLKKIEMKALSFLKGEKKDPFVKIYFKKIFLEKSKNKIQK
jgi:hypothetical protein